MVKEESIIVIIIIILLLLLLLPFLVYASPYLVVVANAPTTDTHVIGAGGVTVGVHLMRGCVKRA
jgi:hypothetical protein